MLLGSGGTQIVKEFDFSQSHNCILALLPPFGSSKSTI